MKIKSLCVIASLVLLLSATTVGANMTHVPTTYGLSARTIAMGNASTALTEDLCLPYFNPASMAMTNESKLGVTYLYAQPNFDGGIKNGSKDRFDVANKVVSMGMIWAMDEFLKSNRKLAFGLNATLDDNGKAFIRFNDLDYDNGYYYRYGEASFVINAGFGFEIVEWFYMGLGVLTTLHSDATFYVDIDLAGRTENEGMTLDADVVVAPIVSSFTQFDPVSIGLTYHGETHGRMGPIVTKATNTVGGSKLVDLPLNLYFKDAYLPQKLSLGVAWQIVDDLLWSIDGVWYNWGGFDEEMSKDDLVRDSIDFDFVDTYVPRTGFEYQVVEKLFLRFGYSYETSPLRKPGSNGNYLLDNNKHIGGLGIGYDLELGILNYPISLDAAYTHQYLAPWELESSDGTKLESKGNLSGGTASVTIRF